jgi:DNA-directed RNA polymerase subunit RPC12/RpoP
MSVKIEAILHGLFLPRGYDIMTLPDIDEERMVGRAELRDNHGIHVMVQYHEWELDMKVDAGDLEELDSVMVSRDIPKGICLATTNFTQAARDFARRKNILLKDSDQLMEMVRQAEVNVAAQAIAGDYTCMTCGSRLRPSDEIKDLMECVNPDCGKTYRQDELDEAQKQKLGDIKTFTISCYECSRPVELDTSMRGLVECPYDDCSWIINVDNELLALKGGIDKRTSENLAEIVCPKCQKTIKVPADAEGLMECPCEERWVIDVGEALGARAQASAARRLFHGDDEAQEAAGSLLDCPGCGAGVPAGLDSCPVCGAQLPVREQPAAPEETREAEAIHVQTFQAPSPGGGGARQMTHRHAYLNLSTGGILLLAAFSVAAFLAFVYLVVR